jgi:hypothetical protein
MATVDAQTAQKALDMVLSAIGIREAEYSGTLTIRGKDPVLASRHRFGELMAAAQVAFGMGLGRLWELRGGKTQTVTTSVQNAVHLPTLIDMPDIKPGFLRSTQPLGSSLLAWT